MRIRQGRYGYILFMCYISHVLIRISGFIHNLNLHANIKTFIYFATYKHNWGGGTMRAVYTFLILSVMICGLFAFGINGLPVHKTGVKSNYNIILYQSRKNSAVMGWKPGTQ